MRERLFGTDGVRGIPGRFPLDAATVRRLGAIAARLLLERRRAPFNGRGPFLLLGRDTRESGPVLSRVLIEGFRDAGCRTVDLGVLPTPGVSYLVPALDALAGAVISASHNPAEFNGLKFFDGAGCKMDPATEDKIEARLRSNQPLRETGPALTVEDGSGFVGRYLDFLKTTFPATLDLCGLTLVIDCAHGAASGLAPALFRSLGARVHPLACAPDGRNINAGCGALHPERMRREVVRRKADCGICFDGDADRCLFSDEKGRLIDGDTLICLGAEHLRRQGLLSNDKVVLTVMSNFGLIRSLESSGVSVISVPVGDRNVSEAIERENVSLGGENSGHIIYRRYACTGDGMLTALQTLAALRESGLPLSRARRSFRPVPQLIKNLHVERKPALDGLEGFQSALRECEESLRGEGRVFVRYSGTEPLLRIMVEGPSRSRIQTIAETLAAAFLKETAQ